MSPQSLVQKTAKVHPLILLPAVAALSWFGVGLISPAFTSAPAAAKTVPDTAAAPKAPRAADARPIPSALSSTGQASVSAGSIPTSLPAQLPAMLVAAPAVAAAAAALPSGSPLTIGPAAGGDAGGASGDSSSSGGDTQSGKHHNHAGAAAGAGTATTVPLQSSAQPALHHQAWPSPARPLPAAPHLAHPAVAAIPPVIRMQVPPVMPVRPMMPQFLPQRPAYTPQFAPRPSILGGLFSFLPRGSGGGRGYGGGRLMFRRR